MKIRSYLPPETIPVDDPSRYWIGQPLDGSPYKGELRPYWRVVQIGQDSITVAWCPPSHQDDPNTGRPRLNDRP